MLISIYLSPPNGERANYGRMLSGEEANIMKKWIIPGILITIILLSAVALAGCGGGSPIEDIKWILTSYGPEGNTKNVMADTEVTVTFDSKTREAGGNAGCNQYGGGYTIDGDDLTMEGPFAVTEMWCGEEKDAQEKEYLDILLSAERYEVENGKLTIYSGDNVLNFVEE
jgi:heat shock protein HslJ